MTNATADPDAHPALLDTGNLKGFIPNMTAQNSTAIVGAPSSSTARLANNGLITANLEFQGTLRLPNHPRPVCGFQGFAFDQLHAKPGDPHIVAVKDLTPYFEVLLRDYAVSYLRHLTTDVIVNLSRLPNGAWILHMKWLGNNSWELVSATKHLMRPDDVPAPTDSAICIVSPTGNGTAKITALPSLSVCTVLPPDSATTTANDTAVGHVKEFLASVHNDTHMPRLPTSEPTPRTIRLAPTPTMNDLPN